MKTPEQWDKEGVCFASVAKKIQDDALQATPDLEKLAWTKEMVRDMVENRGYLIQENGYIAVADAHNAALQRAVAEKEDELINKFLEEYRRHNNKPKGKK